MTLLRIFPVSLAFAFSLSACSTTGFQSNRYVYADYVSLTKHHQHAKFKLAQGDYQGALTHLYVLNALQPDNPEFISKIRSAKSLANRIVKLETLKGEKLVQKGRPERAKHHFLKALRIEPTNRNALNHLKQINSKEVKETQLAHLKKVKKKKIFLAETD